MEEKVKSKMSLLAFFVAIGDDGERKEGDPTKVLLGSRPHNRSNRSELIEIVSKDGGKEKGPDGMC